MTEMDSSTHTQTRSSDIYMTPQAAVNTISSGVQRSISSLERSDVWMRSCEEMPQKPCQLFKMITMTSLLVREDLPCPEEGRADDAVRSHRPLGLFTGVFMEQLHNSHSDMGTILRTHSRWRTNWLGHSEKMEIRQGVCYMITHKWK